MIFEEAPIEPSDLKRKNSKRTSRGRYDDSSRHEDLSIIDDEMPIKNEINKNIQKSANVKDILLEQFGKQESSGTNNFFIGSCNFNERTLFAQSQIQTKSMIPKKCYDSLGLAKNKDKLEFPELRGNPFFGVL